MLGGKEVAARERDEGSMWVGRTTLRDNMRGFAKPSLLLDVVNENIELFKRFNHTCHSIKIGFSICLSNALGLNGEERFGHSHQEGVLADRCPSFFRYLKDSMSEGGFGQNQHTYIQTTGPSHMCSPRN